MIQSVLYSDTIIQLESVGIRAADTMSMVNSVEPRSFFLTQDIIKFAMNLPAKFKIDFHADDKIMVTKPLLKKLFIRNFGRDLLLPKQGFSGYPNEAGREIVSNFSKVTKFLAMRPPQKIKHSLEWKLLNTEIFLNSFNNHL